MDDVDRLELALYVESGRGTGSEVVRTGTWVQLTTPDAPTEFRNGILRSVLRSDEVDARIDEAIAHYGALPFRWFVTPSTRPADMDEHLARKGFSHVDTLWAMTADARDFPEPAHPDVTVEEIGEDGLEEWLATMGRGWNMPAAGIDRFRKEIRANFAATPRVRHYFLARWDGEPAGSGSLRLFDDFAFFNGGETNERFRKRGVYREMVLARMKFLRERGIFRVTNHCRHRTSGPLCRKLGFRTVCEFRTWRHARRCS